MRRTTLFSNVWASSTVVMAIAVAFGSASAQGPTPPAAVSSVLTRLAGFSAEDLDQLQLGRVVVRTTSAPELLEESVVAAVQIGTTKERTLAYFHQLVSYVDGQVTTGFGTFSRPPVETDLKALKLDQTDLSDLEGCPTGDCAIRLRAAAPGAKTPAIDWSASDSTERAQRWVREQLSGYVSDYMQAGNTALVAFDDQGKSVNLADAWQQIAGRSTLVAEIAPTLHEYVTSYPAASPAGATEEFNWDQQHFLALKPMLGVTHALTLTEAARPERVVVIQKRIWASHYLYASLALTWLVQDPDAKTPVTYVVYANRARGSLLGATGQTQAPAQTTNRGRIGGALSSITARVNALSGQVQRRLGEQMIRQAAEQLLGSMKQALEK